MTRSTLLAPSELARRHSRREARRSRLAHAAEAEIGPMPPVEDPERREACRFDLLRFIETYRPNVAGGPRKPFGPKQLEAIRRAQRCVLDGGRFLNGLPRGFVKSTISEDTVAWAASYGHRSFAVLFGATADDADQALDSIKREFEEPNDLVAGDFPEIAVAVQALEGKPQRCGSQTHEGRPTHIQWRGDTIVLPTVLVPRGWGVPGVELDPDDLVPSDASGAIIRARGLLGASRGMRFKRPDGRQARPDLVVIDDGQTDDSAASPTQTAKRLNVVKKSILRLGGHGRAVAAIWNGTIIAAGDAVDQLSNPKLHPEWQSMLVAMMPRLPDALESFWLGPYAEARRNYDREDPDDQQRAWAKATRLYRENREAADAGAEVSWVDIPLEKGEISAVQHAMNILIDDGPEVFDSECQNAPKPPASASPSVELATAETFRERLNGRDRGEVPPAASRVVFGADVGWQVFHFAVAGVDEAFSGAVVERGTWPLDALNAHGKLVRPLAKVYPGLAVEARITQAVIDLSRYLCGRTWRTSDGDELGVSVGTFDVGSKPAEVAAGIVASGHRDVIRGARGLSIKPGDRLGRSSIPVRQAWPSPDSPHWYELAKTIDGVRRVYHDSGYWKAFLHSRFLSPIGSPGGWTLWGSDPSIHDRYVEHLLSETPEPHTAGGVTRDLWVCKPGRANHWLDTTVLCMVAASYAGCRLPGTASPPTPKRKRISLAARQAERRAGRAGR